MRNGEMTSIFVGDRLRVNRLKTGVDKKGIPYWRFCVAMRQKISGRPTMFDYVWINSFSRCDVENGDRVKILKINGYYEATVVTAAGLRIINKVLYCEVEKVK